MTYDTKKRNRNAIRSKKLIVDAYVQLMQVLPREKITVTAIVEAAGLNRSTFYAHFDRVDDVLEFIGNDIMENLDQIVAGLKLANVMKDPNTLVMRVSEFIEERAEFFKKITGSRSSYDLMQKFRDMIVERLIADVETVDKINDRQSLYINIRFAAGGYISLCRDWLEGKIPVRLTEATEVISDMIKCCIPDNK